MTFVKFTEPQNLTNFYTMLKYGNEVTNNWLGTLIVVTVGLITFISLKNYSTEKAFAAMTFVILIVAVLLRPLDLITDFVFYIVIVVVALSIVSLLIKRKVST